MPRRGKQNDMDLFDAVSKALNLDKDMREEFHTYIHDNHGDSTQGMKFRELFKIGVEFKDWHYSEKREERKREREMKQNERDAEWESRQRHSSGRRPKDWECSDY